MRPKMPLAGRNRSVVLLTLAASALASSSAGCHRTFTDAAQQRCVERSLERAPRDLIVHAMTTFRRACADGDASACSALGVIEERGALAPPRFDVARGHYEVACAARDTRGCANLGRVLLRGLGGPARPIEARMLLERACSSRDPAACGTLGWSLVSGRGLPMDEVRGRELLGDACTGGHALSCVELGDAIAVAPTPERLARSRALWLKACARGVSIACDRVAPRPGGVTESFERLRVAGP